MRVSPNGEALLVYNRGMKKKLDTLKKIAELFKSHHISYMVGGSLMLYLRGYTENFNDIDILIDEKDYDQAYGLIEKIGQIKPTPLNTQFITKKYQTFDLDGTLLDLMAEFGMIDNHGKTHSFLFDLMLKPDPIKVDKVAIAV